MASRQFPLVWILSVRIQIMLMSYTNSIGPTQHRGTSAQPFRCWLNACSTHGELSCMLHELWQWLRSAHEKYICFQRIMMFPEKLYLWFKIKVWSYIKALCMFKVIDFKYYKKHFHIKHLQLHLLLIFKVLLWSLGYSYVLLDAL